MWWPYWLRPILSTRADSRVQLSTFARYAAVILLFFLAVNGTVNMFYRNDYSVLNEQLIGFLAGQHAIGLKGHDVRAFSAAIRFFIPYCPKDRISAELKAVEKSTPTTPTTPITLPILVALACFVGIKLGWAQACGIIVGYFGLLRSAEILRITGQDVILRSQHNQTSTIRLGKTKNNREESVQFGKNSIAERALIFALQLNGHVIGKKLFGFKNYQQIYNIVKEFNYHFNVNIHITPHSLRAGGATHYRMQNVPMGEICLIGRWSDESTAKKYIDPVYAILPETIEAEKRVKPRELTALNPYLAPMKA